MLITLGSFFVGLLAFVSVLLLARFDKSMWWKAAAAASVAAAGTLGGHSLDVVGRHLAEPDVQVSVRETPHLLTLSIQTNQPLDRLTIDSHIAGYVHHVERGHSVAESHDLAYIEGDVGPPFLSNRVELVALGVSQDARLTYNLQVSESVVPLINFADRDVFRLTYVWTHKDSSHQVERWYSLTDGSLVEMPHGRVSAIQMVGTFDQFEAFFSYMPFREEAEEDELIVDAPALGAQEPILGDVKCGELIRRRSVTP